MVLLKKTTLLFLNSVSLLLPLFIFEKHVRVEGVCITQVMSTKGNPLPRCLS